MDETLEGPSSTPPYTPHTKPQTAFPPRIGRLQQVVDPVSPLFREVMGRARNSFTNLFNFLGGLLSEARSDAEKNLVHGLIDEINAKINSTDYAPIGGSRKRRKTKKVRKH
jgi:hypothetical protein